MHGGWVTPERFVIHPLNVLQITVVVAKESASTNIPSPEGVGATGRADVRSMWLFSIFTFVLGMGPAASTSMPVSVRAPVIVLSLISTSFAPNKSIAVE